MDTLGAVLSENRYLPYGEVRTDTSLTAITETDFGYTGQREYKSFGLMDYNARFYSPYLNHFCQPDSIIPGNGAMALNRYMYAKGNPINFVDPRGHVPIPFDEDSYRPPGPDIGGILNPGIETLNSFNGFETLNYDRYDKALPFIYGEMMTSINSKRVADIKNDLDAGRDFFAKIKWGMKVRSGGDWDHKSDLNELLGLEDQLDYYFPVRGDFENEFYYDMYSNIHYGFVGSAAGFDAETLQNAGEDSMFAGENDPGDMISTQIGINLWNIYGTDLKPENITEAILNATDIYLQLQVIADKTKQEFEVVISGYNGE